MNLLRTLLLSLLVALPALAASAQEPRTAEQIELTDELVEAFLASYPELQQLRREFEAEYGQLDADPENPDAAILAYGRYAEARDRMTGIIEEHGISSLEEWGRTGYSIVLAYSFSERGEGAQAMSDEVSQARREIEDNPDIPDEQKEQMLTMLEELGSQFDRIRPSEANMRVVADHAERIQEVLDLSPDRDG